MKNVLRRIAFCLALLPSLAAAQVAPSILPANTVLGRTGIGAGPAQAIPFAQLSQYMFGTIVNNSVLGNVSGGTAFPSTLTATQLTASLCNAFTSSLKGCVPASGGGTTNFLRADGAWTNLSSTAAGTSYTPQGTGGVATTVKAQLDRTIWVNDYGAVCDAVTDDHVAFQNAINEGQSLGLPVRFTGPCAINVGLSITASLDFGGVSSPQSRIIVGSAGAIGITITTPKSLPVNLHDFGIQYASAANAGVAAISVTGTSSNENSGSRFQRLVVNGNINVGIDFVKASSFVLADSIIGAASVGIKVANGNNGDSGDSTIYGNLIQAGTSGTGILWVSSGGTRIQNNKILGSNMNNGINIFLASGVSTSDLIITGNSIEGLSTAGNNIAISRQGATGGLNHVIIANNELGGGAACVNVPTDATGVFLSNLNITSNACIPTNASNSFGFIVGNSTASGVVIMHNNMYAGAGGTNKPVAIGTGMTSVNCVIGYNTQVGTWVASTPGSCTAVAPI